MSSFPTAVQTGCGAGRVRNVPLADRKAAGAAHLPPE